MGRGGGGGGAGLLGKGKGTPYLTSVILFPSSGYFPRKLTDTNSRENLVQLSGLDYIIKHSGHKSNAII